MYGKKNKTKFLSNFFFHSKPNLKEGKKVEVLSNKGIFLDFFIWGYFQIIFKDVINGNKCYNF